MKNIVGTYKYGILNKIPDEFECQTALKSCLFEFFLPEATLFFFELLLLLVLLLRNGKPLLENAGTNLGRSISPPSGCLILLLRASTQNLQSEQESHFRKVVCCHVRSCK